MAILLTIAVDDASRHALEKAGHHVVEAIDQDAGLGILGRRRVDVVLHRGAPPSPALVNAVESARTGLIVHLPDADPGRAAAVAGTDDWLAGEIAPQELLARVEGRLRALDEEAARRQRLGHDLRGPVSLVSGHAELLSSFDWSRHPAGAELTESLQAITDAAAALSRLIHTRVEPPPPAAG